MAKYSEEYKNNLIKRYESGESYYSIAKSEKLTITTIRRWHDKKYINKDILISKELLEEIHKDYCLGIGSTKLQRKYGIPETTIERLLKNNYNSNRLYNNKTKNQDYFEIINTEEKAYILGFIIADGNVSEHNNQFSLKIHLQEKDIDILEFISKELDSTCSIHIKENSNSSSVYVSYTSKKLITDLYKLGVIPNKTGKEYLPFEKIDKKYHNSLICGFFDGDGGLRTSGIISFCSSNIDILKSLQSKMNLNRKINFNRNCYSFNLLKNESKLFYTEYYQKSPYQLKRKKERFENLSW